LLKITKANNNQREQGLGVTIKKSILSVLLVLTFSIPSISEEITLPAGNDYDISIPSDWLEIPKEVLEQYQTTVSETTGQNQTYEYGYQSSKNENWLEYPYVLVQVKHTGRISEGHLKNFKKIESEYNEGIEKLKESAGDLFSNMSMGEPLYDSSIHVLWSNAMMNVQGVGRVKGIIAVKLTEYGFIQFMGYGLEQNFIKYEDMYRNMVYSINLKESDIYKPRVTYEAPTIFGINLGQIAMTAMVCGLISVIFSLLKKSNRKKF